MIAHTEPENAEVGWRIADIDGYPEDWPQIESFGERHPYPDPEVDATLISVRIVGRDEPLDLVVGAAIDFWTPDPEPAAT